MVITSNPADGHLKTAARAPPFYKKASEILLEVRPPKPILGFRGLGF